jgi:YfiH family protein
MESKLLFEKKLVRGTFRVYSDRPNFNLKTVKQIHSDIVLSENNSEMDGDGMIGTSQYPLAVLTADCLPVVLLGENSHAIIHAGWKGVQSKILGHKLLKEMNPIQAFIGPHICVDNYEVQSDFKNNFPNSKSFFENKNKICFDLTKEVNIQLKNLYPNIAILDSNICTFSNVQYHSYRRDKTTNRNWNVYIPEGNTL